MHRTALYASLTVLTREGRAIVCKDDKFFRVRSGISLPLRVQATSDPADFDKILDIPSSHLPKDETARQIDCVLGENVKEERTV
jgi:hypothetical protein